MSTKQNNSWINTFLWVLPGFFFLLGWRWKYTHACNLGQGYLAWRWKERDGWDLEFACEIWMESRLAVEMRLMAEQQQSRALLSSALILPRPASRSATISSIPQRGPVWRWGCWRCSSKSCSHFPATHSANHSSVWRRVGFKDRRALHYNFPPARRSREAQTAKGCWGGAFGPPFPKCPFVEACCGGLPVPFHGNI